MLDSRLVIGFLCAALIAAMARWRRALTTGGAVAATMVGAAAVMAGYTWGVMLVAYFIVSTVISHYRSTVKAERTAGVVAKGGQRDALQVFSNGGVFALAAALMIHFPWRGWMALAAGSLAASAADTWATEIGTLSHASPRSIISWRHVSPGTSGGVTAAGAVGSVAGAAFVSLLAFAMQWGGRVTAFAFLAGIVGATVDSLLGASAQCYRWCDRCGNGTERVVHDCGTQTRRVSGLAWLDNDMVNLLSAASGGLLALLGAR